MTFSHCCYFCWVSPLFVHIVFCTDLLAFSSFVPVYLFDVATFTVNDLVRLSIFLFFCALYSVLWRLFIRFSLACSYLPRRIHMYVYMHICIHTQAHKTHIKIYTFVHFIIFVLLFLALLFLFRFYFASILIFFILYFAFFVLQYTLHTQSIVDGTRCVGKIIMHTIEKYVFS